MVGSRPESTSSDVACSHRRPRHQRCQAACQAACQPFSKVGENLRAVRSQLMLRWFNTDPSRKLIALVSPGVDEGRSFIAANLAIAFSQQGERTLLIDADLRQFDTRRAPTMPGTASDSHDGYIAACCVCSMGKLRACAESI